MYLRKIIKYIFIFLFQPFLLSQSYYNLGIAENYQVKEVRAGDKTLKEKYNKTFYYIYTYVYTKEKVKVYTTSSSDQADSFAYTNYKLSKIANDKLLLEIVGADNESRKLDISFIDNNQSINIDKSTFFLNQAYFSYLKKELLDNRNISELIDLIDDFLEEDIFKLENLKYLNSKSKYKYKKFRILNVKMTTINSQNENIKSDWIISYTYKNGILFSVEQKSKDETRFTKQLIKNRNNLVSYKVYREIDERFSDDKKITFDIKQNKYSEIGTYIQSGVNKETDYEKAIYKSVTFPATKVELDKNEIIKVISKLK
ncbi:MULTISPECIES: hypothetical protein [unclassified Chryseobacterium]|uniref:hypothetical protein n=1 Tax=unclassified Chryseobacterium TaxID=2593645 RepID=UPI00100A972E|nr:MULTISPECIES: hypothetical protein [unclassified Chryseobacterium]RXM51173.1 hypothetical protein BOQ64_13890 [Chryseobacterium sp. CH25]RXM64783.1 hypothetical protein BOQ60_11275 [Chryseobacterium sp. CH1]